MKYILLLSVIASSLANAEPLFYFHADSSWTYLVTGNKQAEVTNKVTEVRTINNKNWYRLVEYGEVYWVSNNEFGQVEAVNFFESDPSQFEQAEEVLIFKFPAEVGEQWMVYDSPVTYIGLKEYTVPAGTFKCHMYNFDMGSGDYSKSCIAKSIGVIYNEAILDGGVKETSKLIDYKSHKL